MLQLAFIHNACGCRYDAAEASIRCNLGGLARSRPRPCAHCDHSLAAARTQGRNELTKTHLEVSRAAHAGAAVRGQDRRDVGILRALREIRLDFLSHLFCLVLAVHERAREWIRPTGRAFERSSFGGEAVSSAARACKRRSILTPPIAQLGVTGEYERCIQPPDRAHVRIKRKHRQCGRRCLCEVLGLRARYKHAYLRWCSRLADLSVCRAGQRVNQ